MMIKTIDYGNVTIVESNVIRLPYDTLIGSVEMSDGSWYDIYALAEDGSLVAVLDECLDD
jgi:hypothetical protein